MKKILATAIALVFLLTNFLGYVVPAQNIPVSAQNTPDSYSLTVNTFKMDDSQFDQRVKNIFSSTDFKNVITKVDITKSDSQQTNKLNVKIKGSFSINNILATYETNDTIDKISYNSDFLLIGSTKGTIKINNKSYDIIVGYEQLINSNKLHLTMTINNLSSNDGFIVLDIGKTFLDKNMLNSVDSYKSNSVSPKDNLTSNLTSELPRNFAYCGTSTASYNSKESVVLSAYYSSSPRKVRGRIWARSTNMIGAINSVVSCSVDSATIQLKHNDPNGGATITPALPVSSSSSDNVVPPMIWSIIGLEYPALSVFGGLVNEFGSKVIYGGPSDTDRSISVKPVPSSIDLSSSISASSADKANDNKPSGVSMVFNIQDDSYSYGATLTGNVIYVARVWRDPLYTQIYVNSGNASVNFTISPTTIIFQNGWQLINGTWYYFENSQKATGWKYVGGYWYYLNPTNGAMQTGWVLVGGKYYYLNSPNGNMAVSTTTPDGYKVGADGAWIP